MCSSKRYDASIPDSMYSDFVLIKQCHLIHCLQSVIVYFKSTDKVKTVVHRLLFRRQSVDFEHVFAIPIVLKFVAS